MAVFGINTTIGQTVTYTFANPQNTNDGSNDYYEVDVQISTDTDFKLGSGSLYFNYNTAAFGTNIDASGSIEISYSNGNYILGEFENDFNAVSLYKDYSINDNTTSRVAFTWQQNYSSFEYTGNNVTGTPTNLCHLKIKYTNVNEDPDVCFEGAAPFDDQTYTACGADANSTLTPADCQDHQGTQLTLDNFECANAVLPVEFIYFTAVPYEDDALLSWATASEINNSHFDVERSIDGINFEKIGEVAGNGTTLVQQSYEFIDDNPILGENYYRLRQVDFDGRYEYTEIELVVFGAETNGVFTVAISPNPATHILNIQSNQTGIDFIQVYNSLGQLVLEEPASTQHQLHKLNVEALAGGSYYLKVSGTNDINRTLKFIKN